ncbi:MAG: hypothetical protein ABW020_09775 [Candidatus Rokuibacteriota bacterium]
MGQQYRATKPLDPEAVKAADAAVGGRKLGSGPEDAADREKWMEAYKKAGGKVEPIEQSGKAPGSAVLTCPAKHILAVKLVSVTFTTDHGLLTDKFTASADMATDLDRWQPGGTKYQDIDPKEWTPAHNFPISHTKSTRLDLIAEFECEPADAGAVTGFVTAISSQWTFTGKGTFQGTNAAKSNTVKITMKGDDLPEEIQKLKQTLSWEVEVCGQTFTAKSGPHTVYVTYDTPRAFPDREVMDANGDFGFPPQPLGITLKRMDRSVEMVEPGDTTEPVQRTVFAFDAANPKKTVSSKVDLNRPHVIVSHLMKQFKDYELNAKKELEKFMHPTYMNLSVGGAWPIADFIKPSAECQAIVRFVRNVINQLGVPGTADTLYVFAKPESPNDAQESDQRNGYKKHALVDRPITDSDVGKVFPPSHTRTDSGISMGFNQYEACMRFSYGDPKAKSPLTLYYGGGAGVYKDHHAVLRAFTAMVEVEGAWWPSDTDPKRVTGVKIVKILARYQ